MRWAPLVMSAGLLLGCAADTTPVPELPKLVAVSGTVTLEGKPVDGAAVMFMPAGQGYGAVGGTDAAGKYTVQTRTGDVVHDGVPPGEYKVVISRMVKPDGTPLDPISDPNDPANSPANRGGRESLPPKFSSPVQTSLKASVVESELIYNFDLKP